MPVISCCGRISVGEGPNELTCPKCGRESSRPEHKVEVKCEYQCKNNLKGICMAENITVDGFKSIKVHPDVFQTVPNCFK